ncbi:cytochrome P450 [Lanmaoa asiatica]|nr:cytochrome P450 [Lanmaoa asiatica]
MVHWSTSTFNSGFRFCRLVPSSHRELLAVFGTGLRYFHSREILATCCLIAGILVRRYLLHRKKSLLPGPPASFFTGNLRQVPKGHPWKIYHEWSQKWGSVLYLRLFGRDVIVFNGVKVAEDLLEKRSKIYCDRPTWSMADLIGRQDNVGFAYYGENLKSARKLLHSALGQQSRANWGPMLDAQTLGLLRQLAASGQAWESIVKKHVASVVVSFTYGTDATDEYVQSLQQINEDTGMALQPGEHTAVLASRDGFQTMGRYG